MYQTYIMYTHPYPSYTKLCTFLYHYQGLYRVEKINMHPRLYLEQTILEKIVITLGRFDSQRQGIVISCLLLSAKRLFEVFTNLFIMFFFISQTRLQMPFKVFNSLFAETKKRQTGRNSKKKYNRHQKFKRPKLQYNLSNSR